MYPVNVLFSSFTFNNIPAALKLSPKSILYEKVNFWSWFCLSGIIHIAFFPGFLEFPFIVTLCPLFTIEILPIDEDKSCFQAKFFVISTCSACTAEIRTSSVSIFCFFNASNKSFSKLVTSVFVLDFANTISILGFTFIETFTSWFVSNEHIEVKNIKLTTINIIIALKNLLVLCDISSPIPSLVYILLIKYHLYLYKTIALNVSSNNYKLFSLGIFILSVLIHFNYIFITFMFFLFLYI